MELEYRKIYDLEAYRREYHPKKIGKRFLDYSGRGIFIGKRTPFKTRRDVFDNVMIINRDGKLEIITFYGFFLNKNKLIIENDDMSTSGCQLTGWPLEYFKSIGITPKVIAV